MHRNPFRRLTVSQCGAGLRESVCSFLLALLTLVAFAATPVAAIAADAPAQTGAAAQPEAASGQPAEAARQQTQPLNNAPVWRDVRSGDINQYQTTQVRGIETNILVQTEGEV